MSIDVLESFKVEEFGVSGSDENDIVQFYFTGGMSSPVGTASAVPTLYLEGLTGNIWRNTGSGPSDWIQVGSSDLCIGGVSASYIHTAPNCVGGGDANGD